MSKLIICDKPSKAKDFQMFLEEKDRIILCPTTVSYQFDYENLYFVDAPFFGRTPQYKTNIAIYKNIYNNDYLYNIHTLIFDKNSQWTDDLLLSFFNLKKNAIGTHEYIEKLNDFYYYLSTFDEIIFCCDTDTSGIRGFDFYFKYYLEISDLKKFCKNNNIELNCWLLGEGGLSLEGRKKMIKMKESYFSFNSYAKEKYQKKDYFEYNYNINSLLLINKSYKKIFGEYPDYVLTKNFIQSIFFLHKEINIQNKKSISFWDFIEAMVEREIGHEASRNTLINRLVSLNLVLKIDTEDDKGMQVEDITFTIGSKTVAFLDLLHRKLNDPHLSERTYNDIYFNDIDFDTFKIKYDNYLKSTFGKQKRFINKNIEKGTY